MSAPAVNQAVAQHRRQVAIACAESVYTCTGHAPRRRSRLPLFTLGVLIAAALVIVISSQARAAEVAFLPNQTGGQIVLTDVEVTLCPNARVAYARSADGTTTWGCWNGTPNFISVDWAIFGVTTYPTKDFLFFEGDAEVPVVGFAR